MTDPKPDSAAEREAIRLIYDARPAVVNAMMAASGSMTPWARGQVERVAAALREREQEVARLKSHLKTWHDAAVARCDERDLARQELATAKGIIVDLLTIPRSSEAAVERAQQFLAPAVEGPQPTHAFVPCFHGIGLCFDGQRGMCHRRGCNLPASDPIHHVVNVEGNCTVFGCSSRHVHAQTVRPADPNEPEYRKLYGKGIAPAPVRPAETPETAEKYRRLGAEG